MEALPIFNTLLSTSERISKFLQEDHRQHITRELADKLSAVARGKSPDERLLGIPSGPDPAAYICADYTAGGVTITTTEGKATWHLLRKTFINSVVRSGADLKTIMEMARLPLR
jgi:hypothetical protein